MNQTWRATSAGLDIYYFKVTNLINQVHYSPNQEYLTMLVTTHFIRRHKAGTREKVIAKGANCNQTTSPIKI